MAINKHNGWRAPYTSSTFRDIADRQTGKNGLLALEGTISTQLDNSVRVPPFSAIQQGLIFTKDTDTVVPGASRAAPYYLTVTSPSPTNIDNLVWSYAYSEMDITGATVLVAAYDGLAWRPTQILSSEGILQTIYDTNVKEGSVGPYEGLRTSKVSGNYEVTPGGLIDKLGEDQVFSAGFITSVIDEDPDLARVDRILYRRPTDFRERIGYLKFELGGTYAVTPAALHASTFVGTPCVSARVVVDSANIAHIFVVVDGGVGFDLKYFNLAEDRVTASAVTTIFTGLTQTNIDVIIDHADGIHLVYVDTNLGSDSIFYAKLDTTGTVTVAPSAVDSTSGDCANPKCALDPVNAAVYIVYHAVEGAYNQVYFAKRHISGAVAMTQIHISTSGVTNQNPSVFVSKDYVMFIAWETAAGSIYFQRFDKFAVKIDAQPTLVSDSTVYGGGTLSGGATNPKVIVTDNEQVFIAFQQDHGGDKYGVAVWGPDGAYMVNALSSTESLESYDLYIETIYNQPAIIVGRASGSDFIRLSDNEKLFTINLTAEACTDVAFVRDRKGSFLNISAGDYGVKTCKTPAQSYEKAFVVDEMTSDILLARMTAPGDVILEWIKGTRPGSFYDFLVAHGDAIVIDWEVTAAGTLLIGQGLKILDMFSGVDYTLDVTPVDGNGKPTTSNGRYLMPDGTALYVVLDGVTTSVQGQLAPLAQVPWDETAVVLGFIKEGKFNPALLGVAGLMQLDSGESVIFGQDLPQSIRARLGIISETSFQLYTSTIGQNGTDTYPQSLSNIDIMAGQNPHLRILGLAADWQKTTVDTLTIKQDCFIHVPGLVINRNMIAAQSITLADGQAAYVNINRTAGADATIAVAIADLSTLILERNTFVLARRYGADLAVGGFSSLFKPNDDITDVYDEGIKRVDFIDRILITAPTGAAVVIDDVTLVDGDKVLFANTSFDTGTGIYIYHDALGTATWIKSAEFSGSLTPNSKSCVQIFRGSEINKMLWAHDAVKGWYRMSALADFVEVRAADLTTDVLPVGAALVVDGQTILDGEVVLFGHADLNRVYRVTGIGLAINFEPLNVFHGLESPQDGSRVLVQDGTASDVMLEYDEELGLWSSITLTYQNKTYLGLTSPTKVGGAYQDQLLVGQLNNVVQEGDPLEQAIKRLDIRQDALKKVTAVDLMSTSLPTGTAYGVDGVVFVDGDTALFIRPALSGIYKISGVGTAISWTKLYEFNGSQSPTHKDTVFVSRGRKTNRTIWLHDPLYNPPWIKLLDPDFVAAFAAVIAQHTLEINQLQDQISSILVNRPNFEYFTAGVGGQKIFDLTKFATNGDNSVLDVYVVWNGRWQNVSAAGDFSDGEYRKNSTTQIEIAETIPEGETVTVYMWDPAALFTRVIKIQKFTADLGGQSIFTLNPLYFTVEPANDIIDCEYLIDGRWQPQSVLGTFADGAVRKNSAVEIELAEPIAPGKEFIVIRRVPTGVAPAGTGGGGGSDVSALTTPIGFVTPQSVGTILRPAESLIIQDQATSDVWKIEVVSGVMQVVKVN